MGIWYATREDVMRALDSKETARSAAQIDRGLEAGARTIEALCHRIFYPRLETKRFDWPNSQHAAPWRLWLDANELASVTSVTSGGVAIAPSSVLLESAAYGPPYNRIELSLASSAAFGGGDTHQQDIAITGLWAGAAVAESEVGTITASVDAVQTTVPVDGAASAELGVGSVIRIGSERMAVTSRAMLDTSQNLAVNLDAKASTVTVPVASTAGFARDEIILIDAERLLIVDIAGSNLIVKRAWDGSVLAAHMTGADIYAPRTLTVLRAALGTTAAIHSSTAAVIRWDPPGLVNALNIAEAISTLTQEQSGYSMTVRTGESGSERTRDLRGVAALRQQVYDAHGRKARLRGI